MFFAKVRLYNPEGYLPDGSMVVKPEFLEWDRVPYLEPEQCGHQESMCRGCVDTWEIDFEVQLPSLV